MIPYAGHETPRITVKARLLIARAAHPNWSLKQIAAHVDCNYRYARSILPKRQRWIGAKVDAAIHDFHSSGDRPEAVALRQGISLSYLYRLIKRRRQTDGHASNRSDRS